MTSEQILEQARMIFRTSKLIRDRAIRAHTAHPGEHAGEGECRDLSLSQMHVILATRERGQVTVTELADIGGVSPPSASAMVDRLVEKGILIREHSQEDRRKVIVRVSPEAEEFIAQAEERLLQFFMDLVKKIGPEAAHQWVEALEKVREVILREGHRAPAADPARR